jgi:hypothetical protein
MKKFLGYYFIYRTTKNPMMAAQIYQMIYQNKQLPTQQVEAVKGATNQISPTNKKEELEESLKYLKSKTLKTKKDKESINIIESILVNTSY